MGDKIINNIVEGLKCIKLSREFTGPFNAVGKSVNDGIEVPVELEVVNENQINVYKTQADGATTNITHFGKILKDEDNKDLFESALTLVNDGCDARAYGVQGNALLIKVKKLVLRAETKVDNSNEEKTRIIGFLGEEELNKRIEALKKHGIEEGSVLFNQTLSLIKPSDEVLPEPKEYKFLNKNGESPVKKLIRNLAVGNHPILEGEKSLGKNVAWSYVAWILNAKIIPLQCHERLTQADILGYLSSDMTNKNKLTENGLRDKIEAMKTGAWTDEAIAYQSALDKCNSPDLVFTKGPLVEAIMRANNGYGTILLLDEMNLADGNVISGTFNMVTDGSSDHIFVTGIGNIPLPKENLLIGATQNPPIGNYTGIHQQNTATQSRFTAIIMPNVPSIAPILHREADKWGVPDFIIDKMNEVYNTFKQEALNGQDAISTDSLNIRGFESAIRLCGMGCSERDAVLEGVINTVSDLEERFTLSEILDNFIDEKGHFRK